MKGEKMARRSLLKASVAAAGLTTALSGTTKAGRKKEVLISAKAALPIGPYSQGIRVGNLVYVAGEKGIDPKTAKIVPGGIVAETRQTLENIKAILAEAGATMDNVVAANVYLTDLKDFEHMNQVYAEYFRKDPPVRTTVQVAALPAGAIVEITVVAAI